MTPILRVKASEVRRLFNEARLHEKTKTGELVAMLMKNKHPSPQPAQEPFCTRSQMVSYVDSAGVELARVHQYLRPDGTIGASGRPDPKRLLWDGKILLASND
jgi:hypothetical protein